MMVEICYSTVIILYVYFVPVLPASSCFPSVAPILKLHPLLNSANKDEQWHAIAQLPLLPD